MKRMGIHRTFMRSFNGAGVVSDAPPKGAQGMV